MPDGAVVQGLLQGLTSGIDSFTAASERAAERKAREKRDKQILLSQGFIEDPETGAITPGEGLLRKRDLENQLLERKALGPDLEHELNLARLDKTRAETDRLKKGESGLVGRQRDPELRDIDLQIKKARLAKLTEGGDMSQVPTRKLDASQVDRLSGYDASDAALSDIEKAIGENKEKLGPFMGRLSSLNPYDTSAQSLNALTKTAAQNIGKSLEGGKLTDQDIIRYQKMLPTNTDTPEVALEKLSQVKRMIAQRRAADLDTFEKAGSRVQNFSAAEPNPINITQPKGLIRGASASQKIKVSNGRETLMIDPADFGDAQKDGFKAVK